MAGRQTEYTPPLPLPLPATTPLCKGKEGEEEKGGHDSSEGNITALESDLEAKVLAAFSG